VSAVDQYMPTKTGTGLKGHIQRMGGFLAGMVMPNIAAFIAWGLITALFIPTGWLPKLHIFVAGSAHISALVSPMVTVQGVTAGWVPGSVGRGVRRLSRW
jgi:PTS system mannitol-specific IIC component